MKKLLLAVGFGLWTFSAWAICPVCTVAVGAGLESARLLGMDDLITGIWAGGFTLILVFWTAKWLNKKGLKSAWWYLGDIVLYYGLLASIYLLPGVQFGVNTIWGIDKFMLGAIVGTIVLYAAEKHTMKSIRSNGGKSRFKFQKVIVPFVALLVASAIAWFLV
jgi:hypothetical protein